MAQANWTSLGSLPTGDSNWAPQVVQSIDLHLEAFTLDGTGGLWHIGQTSPGAGWSQWASLGNPFARAPLGLFQFSVANNVAGRLELFVPSPDGVLHSWQTSPGGEWSTWASLGTPPNRQMGKGPVVGTNANERLEVFSFDSQGALWHIWQQSSGGGWSSWTQFETPSDFSEQWDIATGQDADGHLVIFFRDTNGVLWYTS